MIIVYSGHRFGTWKDPQRYYFHWQQQHKYKTTAYNYDRNKYFVIIELLLYYVQNNWTELYLRKSSGSNSPSHSPVAMAGISTPYNSCNLYTSSKLPYAIDSSIFAAVRHRAKTSKTLIIIRISAAAVVEISCVIWQLVVQRFYTLTKRCIQFYSFHLLPWLVKSSLNQPWLWSFAMLQLQSLERSAQEENLDDRG